MICIKLTKRKKWDSQIVYTSTFATYMMCISDMACRAGLVFNTLNIVKFTANFNRRKINEPQRNLYIWYANDYSRWIRQQLLDIIHAKETTNCWSYSPITCIVCCLFLHTWWMNGSTIFWYKIRALYLQSLISILNTQYTIRRKMFFFAVILSNLHKYKPNPKTFFIRVFLRHKFNACILSFNPLFQMEHQLVALCSFNYIQFIYWLQWTIHLKCINTFAQSESLNLWHIFQSCWFPNNFHFFIHFLMRNFVHLFPFMASHLKLYCGKKREKIVQENMRFPLSLYSIWCAI